MSEESSNKKEKSNKGFNPEKIMMEIGKFTRKVNTLSKAVDFTLEEVMPKIFQQNIEKAYEESKKSLDFFMRHLV